MSAALCLMKELLTSFFFEKDTEKAAACLTDDICIYGFFDDGVIEGINQVKNLMSDSRYQEFMSRGFSIWDEREMSDCGAAVGFLLEYGKSSVRCRVTCSSRRTDLGDKLFLVHFSLISPCHGNMLFPNLINTLAVQTRQQLLSDTTAGGMMGGYIEEGFPFYFVNARMLDYLGYESEQEFCEDIQGKIINCMHPEDRERVNRHTLNQIEEKNEYQVEYRMQKKDRSYIWVHDIGRRITAEDGRDAIVSVCYDITKEKEYARMTENLVDTMKGGMVLYTVDSGWRLSPIYVSAGVGAMSDCSNEEYRGLCSGNVLDTVYINDREAVLHAFQKAISSAVVTNITFRIPVRQREEHIWVNGMFSRYGEQNGKPVVRAVFTPVSLQYDLQLQALNQSSTGIYIVDSETDELYYANDACFYLYGVPVCDITGRKSQDVFGSEVENDKRQNIMGSQTLRKFFVPQNQRSLSSVSETKNWQGRQVLVTYLHDITEKVKADKAIRQNEAFIQAAYALTNVFTWIFEVDTGLIYTGKLLQEQIGLPERMTNFPECTFDRKMLLSEYVPLYRQKVEAIKNGEKQVEFEARAALGDGKIHWLRYRFCMMDVEDGQPRIAVCSACYIDTEKALEARFRLEQQKHRGYEQGLLGYLVVNISRNIVVEHIEYEGRNFHAVRQRKAGIALETDMESIKPYMFPSEAGRRYIAQHTPSKLLALYHAGKTAEVMEGQRIDKTGNVRWSRSVMSLVQEPDSRDIYLYESVYDIHKEKVLEAVMAASLEYSYESCCTLNLRTRQASMLDADKGGVKREVTILSYPDYAMVFAHVYVLKEDEELYLKASAIDTLQEQLKASDCYSFIYRSLEKGEIHYKQNSYMYHDRKNKVCIMTRTDITSLVMREESKRRELTAALKAKSDFLARVSHDLRTPMNAIIGLTALTLDDAGNPEAVRDYMTKMRSASDFMRGLVEDILDMAKIEEGGVSLHPEPYFYREFLVNMKTMFVTQCEQKGLSISFMEAQVDALILVDKTRLNQIFFNIFSNAVKYTPPGGHIWYTVEHLQTVDGKISADYIIRDDGIGMSEEFQKTMFEPFTQESAEITPELQGSGLGLSIAKQLIDRMGGTLSIESKKGQGTTVRIHLCFPLVQTEAGEACEEQVKREGQYPELAGRRVLLAEDHPLNAMIARKLLEKQNIVVISVEDGEAAVKAYSTSKAGGLDAILMDIRMPGVDGYTAARRIRSMNREDAKTIPIIAVTANAYAEDIEKSKEAGMNFHLAKPIEPERLYEILRRCILKKIE